MPQNIVPMSLCKNSVISTKLHSALQDSFKKLLENNVPMK